MEDVAAMSVDLELEQGQLISLNLEKNSHLCQNSTAESHKRLCESVSSMTTLIKEEGKPLTPLSYLAATISSSSPPINSNKPDTSSLTSFLSILLPLIPSQSLPCSEVLSWLLKIPKLDESPATVCSVIKSLGFLIVQRDLEDWNSAKSALELILEFSIDKRPEIRESAQVSVGEIYKSGQFANEASELFLSMLFYKYLPYAIAVAWSRIEITEDSEHAEELMLMESVHMVTVLKLVVEYLSNGVVLKIMDHIHMIMGSKYSLLTRPLFAFLEASFESPRAEEIIAPKVEIVIFALGNYVSPKQNNPVDTVLSASMLLKRCIDELRANRRIIWLINLPLVFEAMAGVVGAGLSVSGEAAGILNELVNQHIDDDLKTSASGATLSSEDTDKSTSIQESKALESVSAATDSDGPSKDADKSRSTPESKALESVCAAIDKMQLTHSDGELNEDVLSVVKQMFLKLGDLSYFYMKGVVHKLTELQRVANADSTRTNYQYLEAVLAVLGQNPADCG